jgi:hypothetical protein
MRTLLVGLLAASVAVGVSGCIFVDAHFGVTPDGSTDAVIEFGMLKSLAERAEGEGAEAEFGKGLAEGKWEQQQQFERDGWQVTAFKGHAGPGESLFAEEADVDTELRTETRLLSTIYEFTMTVPQQPLEVEAPPPAEAPPEAEQGVEIEGADEIFGDVAAMMMTSGQSGVRFGVSLPGRIIESNGVVVAPGGVAWRLDLNAQEAPPEAFRARSRLPNWQSIGRMGAALTGVGRADLVPVLIAAVERGLVPDPQTDAPLQADFNLQLYGQLLDIVLRLDAAVGPELTNVVMGTLQLNRDSPDAARVAKVLERVSAQDFAASVQQEVAASLVKQLGAP